MKNLLFSLSIILAVFSLTAQVSGVRFETVDEPGVEKNGQTVIVNGSTTNVIAYLNLINVSGNDMNIKFERVVISMSNPNYTDQLCDDFYCYPTSESGTNWILANSFTFSAGAQTSFKPELATGQHGGGSARMMYYVRNAQNERIDSVEVLFNTTVSIQNENPLAATKVYPNPSSGQITVKDAPAGSTIEITDMVGKMIYKSKISSVSQSFDLSSNPDGVYFYTIKSPDGTKSVTKRLVIRR